MQTMRMRGLSLYSTAGQRKYINGTERVRFIAAARTCDRLIVRTLCLTLVHTGARISEVLALTRGDVQIGDGCIAIRCLKKRGVVVVREIPVPADLLNALEDVHAIMDGAPDELLWPFARCRAWQLIKAVMAQAGIMPGPHATPKGLRHGFGLHAIRSGVPLNLVQRWLGHASMVTTAIYLQAMGEEEREIAERMWR